MDRKRKFDAEKKESSEEAIGFDKMNLKRSV